MKKEIYINPALKHLSIAIHSISENFENLGEITHSGRNQVRVIDANGLKLVAKYFKRITLANRYIYATFRKSKAQRSFENSVYLLSRGINTPEPIAYINIYRFGMLYRCYYISIYTDFKPLTDIFEQTIPESEDALKAFAQFTFKLHRVGVAHNDYTVNNILYTKENNRYKFSLIDNNRMTFRKYSYTRGIKDLERLKIPVDKMGIIAAEYAKHANVSDLRTLNAIVFYRITYIVGSNIKKWLKRIG